MAKGYKILKIYEVYHFSETTQYNPLTKLGGLFADYINMWLRHKQQSSGYPDWCVDDEMCDQYIASYLKNEGIQLDKEAIVKNSGRRYIAKLKLNR